MNKDNNKRKIDGELLGTYINPKTDFGFHRVFSNPDMMKSFLNEVLSDENEIGHITSLTYLPTDDFGGVIEDEVIFDIHCLTSKGEEMVVELQNANVEIINYENKLLFCWSYLMQNNASPRKRKIKNKEQAVYIVAIVNFPMLKSAASKNIVIERIQLMSPKTSLLLPYSNSLNFVIVDLTKFKKKASNLKTPQDYWLFTLKHAETLKTRPEKIQDELFIDLYDNILPTSKLTEKEIKEYNNSVNDMTQ
ncbi:MAG: Rpn family recombination-promoting nuclease/putative transposase [Prevotellaceae bacterium]|jgi:predicted transposase/invertase (TIGR01784 family)|nr:Rpn family recombination-promoting nuclease/putative transposase [Prevotellaceae bacterium]